jgi:hypothetical protein
MRLVPTFLRAATAIVLLSTIGTPAYAFDLTGNWVGKYTCKGFDGTKFTGGNKTSTLAITQTGNTIAANIDAAFPAPDGDFRYNGFAIPDSKSPDTKGEVVILGCHLANTAASAAVGDGELMRGSVKTKAGTFKATFKSTSIFQDDFPDVGTCKYSYKRVDTNDPGVAACP